MNATRSAGNCGSIGRYAARPSTPPGSPSTISTPRGRHRPDHRLRTHTRSPQITRQPIRPRVQLAHTTATPHRPTTATASGAAATCRANSSTTVPSGTVDRSVVPARSTSSRSPRPARRHRRTRTSGVRRHRLQHPHQPARQPLHRRPVEQIRRRGHRAPQPGRPALLVEHLADASRPGRTAPAPSPRRRPSPHRRARPGRSSAAALGVLHGQHHLEQRVPGQRPGRRQLLHQPLERHILMRQRTQARLPHPGQHLRNVRSPDRSVRITNVLTKNPTRSSSASSVRPATADPIGMSVPAPEPRQQHRQRGLQHHERRHALGPGQLHQPLDAPRPAPATARGARGDWPPPDAAGPPAAPAPPGRPASACRQ